MTTKDNRFREKKTDNPGPGAYEVNNNMVKKPFAGLVIQLVLSLTIIQTV